VVPTIARHKSITRTSFFSMVRQRFESQLSLSSTSKQWLEQMDNTSYAQQVHRLVPCPPCPQAPPCNPQQLKADCFSRQWNILDDPATLL
jgi:hypothetical protein